MRKVLRAVEMRKDGFLLDKIAEELGVTKSCVSKWLAKYSHKKVSSFLIT
jgi:predicted transcriptional regulator